MWAFIHIECFRANPRQSSANEALFLYTSLPPLTWENLYNLLPARMSVDGSNKRECEEAVMMRWIKLTQIIESELTVVHASTK